MKIDSPNPKFLSPEELSHLKKLKFVVEKALEDGKLSQFETTRIKFLVRKQPQVMYEA